MVMNRYWHAAVCCGVFLSVTSHTQDWKPLHPSAGPSRPVVPDTTVNLSPDTGAYALAVKSFADALQSVVWDGGLLTDELRAPMNGLRIDDLPPGTTPGWPYMAADPLQRVSSKDVRTLPERRTLGTHVLLMSRDMQLTHSYLALQSARALISAALWQLQTTTAPNTTDTITRHRGELYALEGYTEILLADLFCSGVPLNTFAPEPVDTMSARVQDVGVATPFSTTDEAKPTTVYTAELTNHKVRFQPSSTTTQVYRDALAKFDTALTLSSDEDTVHNLARVGKGRAFLALGWYDSAAAAVAPVPRKFGYVIRTGVNWDPDGDENDGTVADREGGNGLPYVSSGDPRTATEWMDTDKLIPWIRIPKRWDENDSYLKVYLLRKHDGCRGDNLNSLLTVTADGTYTFDKNNPLIKAFLEKCSNPAVPFALASWEEAVLIRAEAALHATVHPGADHTWLGLLNELRAIAPIPGTYRPDPDHLPPLHDPGNDHARLALLFAERASWLFLTGERQGDLRRLVRNYHWPQDHVYPTGPYVTPQGIAGPIGHYGTDITLPIPPIERINPNFRGCLDRGA